MNSTKRTTQKQTPHYLSFSLGNLTNSVESLKQLCNDKSIELLKRIKLNDDNKIDVVFWCEHELLGVSHFTKDENGNLMFTLDFTDSTL